MAVDFSAEMWLPYIFSQRLHPEVSMMSFMEYIIDLSAVNFGFVVAE